MRVVRRTGFTLVEMLVVISIIGVLAAILIPTIGSALRRAKLTAISAELSSLTQAIEAYKLDQNDYPPDFSNQEAVRVHIQHAFPRNTRNVLGWLNDFVYEYQDPAGQTRQLSPLTLDPAEALVFWLGGGRFGLVNNPRDPLAGTGERITPYFTFQQERFTDVDDDGWQEYASGHSQGIPYVYFDGRIQNASGGGGICAYAWAVWPSPGQLPFVGANVPVSRMAGIAGTVRPYRSNNPIPATDTYTFPSPNTQGNQPGTNATEWIEPRKFQILSPGLDVSFGADAPFPNNTRYPTYKTYPTPNYAFTDDRDNLSSFSAGQTIGDSVP